MAHIFSNRRRTKPHRKLHESPDVAQKQQLLASLVESLKQRTYTLNESELIQLRRLLVSYDTKQALKFVLIHQMDRVIDSIVGDGDALQSL